MFETDYKKEDNLYQPVEIGAETDETQNEYLAALAVFSAEYPNAFSLESDTKNRPFLTLKNIDNGVNIVCPKGIVLIDGGPGWNQDIMAGRVDLTPVFEVMVGDKADQIRSVEVFAESENGHVTNVIMPYCISGFQDANWPYLRTIFARTEKLFKREDRFEEISNDNAESRIRGLAMDLTVGIA